MPLSRAERFKLKSGLLDAVEGTDSGWNFDRKNLLLAEFGLDTLDGDSWSSPGFADAIAMIADSDLIEMYSIATGVDKEEVQNVVESPDIGGWKSGYVRLFLTHSARHKGFVGEVADELAIVGIHGFVAHDTMEYSKPWQAQIEHALRSMQAFAAIAHPELNDSPWCHQEVGWALGRRVPRYVVRMGADPAGFIGHDQWPTGNGKTARHVAKIISTWASSVPELGETMVDGLFSSLRSAGNYIDAGATADRIATLSDLTEHQWEQLDRIYWSNDQLYTGALPTRALQSFYQRHDRDWPPPKPPLPANPGSFTSPTADQWAAGTVSSEPPF